VAHDVRTIRELGWARKSNGELLALMAPGACSPTASFHHAVLILGWQGKASIPPNLTPIPTQMHVLPFLPELATLLGYQFPIVVGQFLLQLVFNDPGMCADHHPFHFLLENLTSTRHNGVFISLDVDVDEIDS
jgi:hypothetical protein